MTNLFNLSPIQADLSVLPCCLILSISTSLYWHTAPTFLMAVSITESQSNSWSTLLPPDICEAFQGKKTTKKNPKKLHNSTCFSFHILPTLETLPLSNIALFNPFLKYSFTIENFATVWEWDELFAVLMEREKLNYFLAEIYVSSFILQPGFFSQVIKSEDNSSSHHQ